MSKRQVLQNDYAHYLTQNSLKNAEACLFQFREIISSFLQNRQQTSSNPKFLSTHLQYLFYSLSNLNQPPNQQFTTTLQLLNYLVRSPLHFQVKIPSNILHSLSSHLALNSTYKNSMNVIANIVWLICRCTQLLRGRQQFMRAVSESGILQRCMQGRSMERQTQKGVMLLLNYICKRELEQKEIYLTLLKNIYKFSQIQLQSEIFALLRRNRVLQIMQSHQQYHKPLRDALVLYLNNEQVAQYSIFQNHCLIVLAATTEARDFQLLKTQKVLQFLLTSANVDAERFCLKKVCKLFARLFQKQEKNDFYLNLALQTLHSNPISRRIFVQYHEKITYKQFLDILRGDYPKRMETPCRSEQQGNNRLKFLICMRRVASRLGINNFYNFKLRPLAECLLAKGSEVQLNNELVELLQEVSYEQQNELKY